MNEGSCTGSSHMNHDADLPVARRKSVGACVRAGVDVLVGVTGGGGRSLAASARRIVLEEAVGNRFLRIGHEVTLVRRRLDLGHRRDFGPRHHQRGSDRTMKRGARMLDRQDERRRLQGGKEEENGSCRHQARRSRR